MERPTFGAGTSQFTATQLESKIGQCGAGATSGYEWEVHNPEHLQIEATDQAKKEKSTLAF